MTPWLLLALAAAEQADDLPVAAVASGLVVVVGDPGGRFAAGPPRGEVTDEGQRLTFALADDGETPDVTAGDGVYATRLDYSQRGGSAAISITDADGQTLWADLIPIGSHRADPTLKVLVEGDAATARVDTVDRAGDVAALEAPAAQPPPPPPPPANDSAGLLLPVVLGLGGIGAGFAVGRLRGRARLPLAAVGGEGAVPDGLPPIRGLQQRLVVDDPAATLTAWARALSAVGPVLVVPRSESRPAIAVALSGVGGVSWLTTDRPEIGDVLAAADALAALGRVVVLVEGGEAVEAAEEVEAPDAPITDLLAEATADVVVLTRETG